MRFIFSSIFSLIGLLLAAESVFTLHQTQNAFLKDSAHCYEAYQERSQTYAGECPVDTCPLNQWLSVVSEIQLDEKVLKL